MDDPSLVGGAWERGKRNDGWESPVYHTITHLRYTTRHGAFRLRDSLYGFWIQKGAFLETVRDSPNTRNIFHREEVLDTYTELINTQPQNLVITAE